MATGKKQAMTVKKAVNKPAKTSVTQKKKTTGRDWAKMTKAQRKVMIRKADLDPVMAKKAAIDFWNKFPGTLAAATGDSSGAKEYSAKDLKTNRPFLKKLLRKNDKGEVIRFQRVLDAGAGMGRVTDELLRHHSNQVDLLEPWKAGLNQAKRMLETKTKKKSCRFTYLNRALQDFEPVPGRCYDLVWVQGVFLYLSDMEMVTFLQKVGKCLSPTGRIVVKEYVTDNSMKSFLEDADDNVVRPTSPNPPMSVMRSDTRHRAIFKTARMEICQEMLQGGKGYEDQSNMMIYALRKPSGARSR